jgi:serine/threonine-protein kinase
VERIFYHILNEPLKLEPVQQAGAPQAVCDLVARCTAKKPQDRPQGFAPIVAELEQVIETQDAPTAMLPAVQPEPAPAPAPRKPSWMLPVAIAAIVLLGGGLYFATRPKAPVTTIVEHPMTIQTSTGEMVLVPAGNFLFGEKKETASLPAFYIDKTEVSNAVYAQFCKETNRSLPADFVADQPDLPVVNLSLLDAMAFAKWAGKRLPNAKEWEKAARGTDGRTYPWGESTENVPANVGTGKVEAVASRPSAASPIGALNIVGNVWEWVDQEASPSDGARKEFPAQANDVWYEIRGGSFSEPLQPGVVWDHGTVPSGHKDKNIGFRCVK